MTYKDPDKQRRYQNAWRKNRWKLWLQENGPCRECGSWKDLEVDHIDPTKKWSHTIWSYKKEIRERELEKCQALCFECHKRKSIAQSRSFTHGTGYGWKSKKCMCLLCTLHKFIDHTIYNYKRRVARVA